MAQTGDPLAIEALLRRFGQRIYRVCRRLGSDVDDLEEVYQDTLLDLVRYLPRFRGESGLLTWAYTIARTQWNRRRRRKGAAWARNHVDTEIGTVANRLIDPGALPEDRLFAGQLRQEIESVLGGLSEMDRQVLLLRDLEGFSAPEVAVRTGLTVPAVKTRLHRARTFARAGLRHRRTGDCSGDGGHAP